MHLHRDDTDRPQWRTALTGRKLARYNIDIATFSETLSRGEGELCERGPGYTFFWSRRESEERREAGVGFTVETTHVGKLAGLSKRVNDRLMTMKLPLSFKKKKKKACLHHQHLCSIHDQPGRSDLHSVMATVPKADKLIILGDFNARTGPDSVS